MCGRLCEERRVPVFAPGGHYDLFVESELGGCGVQTIQVVHDPPQARIYRTLAKVLKHF